MSVSSRLSRFTAWKHLSIILRSGPFRSQHFQDGQTDARRREDTLAGLLRAKQTCHHSLQATGLDQEWVAWFMSLLDECSFCLSLTFALVAPPSTVYSRLQPSPGLSNSSPEDPLDFWTEAISFDREAPVAQEVNRHPRTAVTACAI